MKRGAWHQLGDKSQKLALEQLKEGSGVGVIISPRDLRMGLAFDYCKIYRSVGADVLIDPQFYIPDSRCGQLPSYEGIAQFRNVVSNLNRLTNDQSSGLAREIECLHRTASATGIVAPAIVYESGRDDIIDSNNHLFLAAKRAGDSIGIPTYRTVVLGKSVVESDKLVDSVLSAVTGQDCDGWYFGFEFACDRIPNNFEKIRRCCVAGLTLANTKKPILHAFAGPLAILSFSFGSTAVGIGHNQNLWQYSRKRWIPRPAHGWGTDAPPRYFSKNLWGTIVYPDEVAMLPVPLLNEIITMSIYSKPVSKRLPFLPWSRWDAKKHFVFTVCNLIGQLSKETNARKIALAVIKHLENAVALHNQIKKHIQLLRDDSDSYQPVWRDVLKTILYSNRDDFDFMEMLE